jgi:hypothetical protein
MGSSHRLNIDAIPTNISSDDQLTFFVGTIVRLTTNFCCSKEHQNCNDENKVHAFVGSTTCSQCKVVDKVLEKWPEVIMTKW